MQILSLPSSIGEFLIKHRVSVAGGLPQGLKINPNSREIGIDLRAVSQIVRDGSIDLLKREHWKRLSNAFGTLPV